MLRRHVSLGAVIGLAVMMSAASVHAQSDEDKAAARALATQGQEALKNNKYSDALDLVTRAEALVHAPTHLLMIARSQVGLGRLVAAQETYLKITREDLAANAAPAFKKAQEDAKTELAALEPRIASLRVGFDNAKDRKITVKIDDQPVPPALIGVYRPIDPGKHEVVAYPVGLSPVKSSLELKDGEKKEIRLAIPDGGTGPVGPLRPEDNPDAKPPVDPGGNPPPPDQPPPSKGSGARTAIGVVGIGLGVVGGVLGTIFMVKKGGQSSQADDLFSRCNPKCNAIQRSDIDSFDNAAASNGTVAIVSFIGGGVALAAGVVILVTGKSKAPPPPPAGAYVTPWFGGTSAGFRGAF